MKNGKLSFTMRYVLVFGVLLFLASAALGLVVLKQSKDAMRTLINKNMLDIVKSAAGSLDGDVLGALTEDDVDGPVFCDIKDRLLVFQDSVDIEFIYAVKQLDNDTYVFTVDPDPVDPGEFGEEVLTTPALVAAAKGVPTVDSSPAADRWGNFYSAYSPVFDSKSKVAGIVGVDFNATWYDEQIRQYTVSIAVVTATSVLLGAFVIMLISNRVRKRFRELDKGLEDLSNDVDILTNEMTAYSGIPMPDIAPAVASSVDTADELELLGNKIRAMQTEMGMYLEYLHVQAYTDALTQVGNSSAYHEAIHELDQQIATGTARFHVAVFDINSLKELNDNHGHECGDQYIRGAARALEQGLIDARVYRIGGDEFAAIAERWDQQSLEQSLQGVESAIVSFNETTTYPATLSISKGTAEFDPNTDKSFKDVFARADHIMYEDKKAYYASSPESRERRNRS